MGRTGWSPSTCLGWSTIAGRRLITGSISSISGHRVRVFAWMIGCALIAGPVWAAQPEGGVSLDQLMATLRAARHVDARYVEHRTLQALRGPIETSGTLRYDAPDRLEKVTDPAANRAVDRLTIQGNQLTIDRGAGAAPVILMLNEHPEIGVLVESIRATLAGDGG